MKLTPKLPPGRSSRKALRYAQEVRRLRAQGHTLESIREALLDVGVTVSVSTVRREAARDPSQWELDRAHDTPLTPAALHAPVNADTDPARHAGPNSRSALGWVSKTFEALRRLLRGGRLP